MDKINKQTILGIIIVLILAGGFIGYSVWPDKQQQVSFIQEVDRDLTDEEKKIYEDRLLEAEKYIAEAQDPQAKSDALIYKAVQLQGLGRLTSARDVFVEAAEVNPDNFNIYVHLYQVYFEMGDYKQAEANIQQSLDLVPNNPDAWRRYFILAIEKLNWPESAVKDLFALAETAVKDKTDIYTSFAVYLEKLGDYEGAIEQWKKAIESHPASQEIYEGEIERLEKKL